MHHRRRAALLAAITIAAPLAGASAAPAQDLAPAAPIATPQGTLVVKVDVNRFSARGAQANAEGTATATLTNFSGAASQVRQKVRLAAATKDSCRVLHLFLEELDLKLLGLNARLEKVQLDITGKSKGGILGQLFCRLSKGLDARGRVRAAAALNQRVRKHPLRALRLQANIRQQTTTGPVCQVLNLVLGPLNLELLGLVVDLNKVKLDVTATPGGGVLGDLFCRLSAGTV